MPDIPSHHELVWEEVPSSRKGAGLLSLDWQVHRAKVPGGWLVLVMHNTSGLTFYPDPEHRWRVTSGSA